jgi:hypothetical protein
MKFRVQNELYGAESSKLFPGQLWGGMAVDTAVFVQSALDMEVCSGYPPLTTLTNYDRRSKTRVSVNGVYSVSLERVIRVLDREEKSSTTLTLVCRSKFRLL